MSQCVHYTAPTAGQAGSNGVRFQRDDCEPVENHDAI
jgi:hypothetical protein